MKTYSIILSIAAVLALGSCSSAYRSAQTPDAVYYSPGEDNGSAQSDNQSTAVNQGDNADGGNYVVYDDNDNNGSFQNDDYYGNDYAGLYSSNSYYMDYPYMGLGYNSLWNYSYGFPSISIGLNWGLPLGRWYRPYYAYSPFYSPFSHGMFYNPYNPWYAYGGGYPYYPGYYGHAGFGGGYWKYCNLTPRPAISWGPRRVVSSNAAYRQSNTSQSGVTTSPRRVFTTQGNTGSVNTGNNTNSPRRVFKAKPGEQPVNVSNGRTVETQRTERRVFRRSDDNPAPSQQRSVEVQRPTRTEETRTFQQPSRSFENNTQSTPTRSVSTPSRTFSPRGR